MTFNIGLKKQRPATRSRPKQERSGRNSTRLQDGGGALKRVRRQRVQDHSPLAPLPEPKRQEHTSHAAVEPHFSVEIPTHMGIVKQDGSVLKRQGGEAVFLFPLLSLRGVWRRAG